MSVIISNPTRIRWKYCAFIVLLASCQFPAYSDQAEPSAAYYQSAAAVQALSSERAKEGRPARVEGVVTQISLSGLTLQDHTGGVWIYTDDPQRFTPGDLIEVQGIVEPGLFAPVVRSSAIRTLGRAALPKPKPVSFRQLSSGDEVDQFVSISGLVLSMGGHVPGDPKWQSSSLEIGMQNGQIHADVRGMSADEASQLVGAVVRIDAVSLCFKNGNRQTIAPALSVPSPHNVTILQSPPASLLATPIIAIDRIMQFHSGTNYFSKVRIKGTVTYYEPGKRLIIEDSSGAILVLTSQMSDVRIGDQLEVLGFPTPANSGPILSNANFTDLGKGAPLKPLDTTIENISTGTMRYNLVSVVGHLIRRANEPSRVIFILQDKSSLLLAELPANISHGAMQHVEEGSTVQISGISTVDVEGPWHYGDAVVQSRLLVRSLSDIQVITPPTWWTTTHVVYIAFIFALLALASLVLLAFSRVERSKLQAVLGERDRLALELHDTLIQGCVGVSSLLEAALGVDSSDDPLHYQLLNYASEQTRTTIDAAREAVWALRSTSAPTADAATICEGLSRHFQTSSGVPIYCHVTGNPFKVSDSAARELMMTVKEALANAVTHANPLSINIDLLFTNSDLRIEIRDDGCGFDSSASLSPNGHYGILGMRERVRLLRGSLTIESKPQLGTKVQITIPRRWWLMERIRFSNARQRTGTN